MQKAIGWVLIALGFGLIGFGTAMKSLHHRINKSITRDDESSQLVMQLWIISEWDAELAWGFGAVVAGLGIFLIS